MGTIRLGKRTDNRIPKINEFIPLATLEDLVFGGWDLFSDNIYQAASTAGVLERSLIDSIRPPWKQSAQCLQSLTRRMFGGWTDQTSKKAANKMELANQLRDDIKNFQKNTTCPARSWSGVEAQKSF